MNIEADSSILFNGSVQVQNSSYRSGNLTITFKNVNTGQSYEAFTAANSGNYSIQIFQGVYEVIVTNIRSTVLFKDLMNIPMSNGVITVNPFRKVAGQLYISDYPKNFTDYRLTTTALSKSGKSLGLQQKYAINEFGKFAITLKKGNYQFDVRKEGNIILSKTIIVDKNQNIEFDLSAPVEKEKEPVADEVETTPTIKKSAASFNFNLIVGIIILIGSLLSVYFSLFTKNRFQMFRKS